MCVCVGGGGGGGGEKGGEKGGGEEGGENQSQPCDIIKYDADTIYITVSVTPSYRPSHHLTSSIYHR